MAPPPGELADRRPVWSALSELFLDTRLLSSDRDRIATALATSPYTIEQLDGILLWEVYRACWSNVFSLAGEWARFDPNWLEQRIRHPPFWPARWWVGTVGRLSRFTSSDWRHIKLRIVRERTAANRP